MDPVIVTTLVLMFASFAANLAVVVVVLVRLPADCRNNP
jgi:hypothetical protein